MTTPAIALLLTAGQLQAMECAAVITAAIIVTGSFIFMTAHFCQQVWKDRRESRQATPTSPRR